MDYFCTSAAIKLLNTITPEDIDAWFNGDDFDYPTELVIIKGDIDSFCIATPQDFKPGTFIENITSIEYFENSIPDWMGVLPGRTYHQIQWDGSWEILQ